MYKHNALYRRLWYMKRRNLKKLHFYSRLAAILIILTLLVLYAQKYLFPYMLEYSENKLEAEVGIIVSDVIKDSPNGGLDYDDIVTVTREAENQVTYVKMNTALLNKISDEISRSIQQKLASSTGHNLSLPIGVLLRAPVPVKGEPGIYIKAQPIGKVEAHYKSEFTKQGSNQFRHTISMQVIFWVKIDVPMTSKSCELITEVPVAETIIVGDIETE